jgi:hypothetical protein
MSAYMLSRPPARMSPSLNRNVRVSRSSLFAHTYLTLTECTLMRIPHVQRLCGHGIEGSARLNLAA